MNNYSSYATSNAFAEHRPPEMVWPVLALSVEVENVDAEGIHIPGHITR